MVAAPPTPFAVALKGRQQANEGQIRGGPAQSFVTPSVFGDQVSRFKLRDLVG